MGQSGLKRAESVVLGVLIIVVFASVLRELANSREENRRLRGANNTLAFIAKAGSGKPTHADSAQTLA